MEFNVISSVYGAGNYSSCGSYTSGSCTTNTSTQSSKLSSNQSSTSTQSSKPTSNQSNLPTQSSKTVTSTIFVSNPQSNQQLNSNNTGFYLSILITVIALATLAISLVFIYKKKKKLNNNN